MWNENYRSDRRDSRSSHHWMKGLLKDIGAPGSGLQKIKQLPDLIMCGPKFGPSVSKAAQRKEKQQWAIEKPNEARQYEKVERHLFLDPNDKEFKEIMKMVRKFVRFQWRRLCLARWEWRDVQEIPIEAAMPCKLKTTKCSHQHREIGSGSNNILKTTRACIVEAHESTRKRLESTLPKRSWRSHRGERVPFVKSLQFGSRICSVASSDENSGCKGRSRSIMGDARWVASVANDQRKWQNKKEVILEAQKEQITVHFATLMGHLSFQKCGVGTKVSKVQRPGRAPRWHCQRGLRFFRCIHRTGLVLCRKWRPQK